MQDRLENETDEVKSLYIKKNHGILFLAPSKMKVGKTT